MLNRKKIFLKQSYDAFCLCSELYNFSVFNFDEFK